MKQKENTSNFENQLNVSIDVLEKYIKNWEMLKHEKHKIYQIGSFNFRTTYKINMSENTHSKGLETETIELLKPRDRNFKTRKFQNSPYRSHSSSNQTFNQTRVKQTNLCLPQRCKTQ